MKEKFVLDYSSKRVEDVKAQVASAVRERWTERFARVFNHLDDLVSYGTGALLKTVTLRPDDPAQPPVQMALPPPTVRITVGIWSLDAWLGDLYALIENLNSRQRAFVFYEIELLVPAGLVSRPEKIQSIMKAEGRDVPPVEEDNLIATDFFTLTDRVLTYLDYVIGITPAKIARKTNDGYSWNHFSARDNQMILASSQDLHELARATDQPMEAVLATIIVAQLLVGICPKLLLNTVSESLFYDLESIVESRRRTLIDFFRDPGIDARMELIQPQYRDAARALVDFIRSISNARPRQLSPPQLT